LTAIVLAGGKNLRLGRNKALEAIGGKSLIECVVDRVKLISNRVLIVTSREHPDFPVAGGVEVVVDLYPGMGPLGGIYTGLMTSRSSRNVVVACDMPFLNIDLLRYMVKLTPGFDVVAPRLKEGMVESLHAIYSRNCLNAIKMQLEHNDLEVSHFFSGVHVRYVEREECQKFDPQLLTFFNINYQADLDQAMTIAIKSK